jgi:hypothetical protein
MLADPFGRLPELPHADSRFAYTSARQSAGVLHQRQPLIADPWLTLKATAAGVLGDARFCAAALAMVAVTNLALAVSASSTRQSGEGHSRGSRRTREWHDERST